jgi:membrane protein
MHAKPQPITQESPIQNEAILSQLPAAAPEHTLDALILRFLRLVRLAFWRAFQHDAFAIAKASAYSSILTFFPALLVVGSMLATARISDAYAREVGGALSKILPAGGSAVWGYLRVSSHRPIGLLISTSLITLWTASGVIISWMDGFRRAYELPKVWGILKERCIALSLVILAGIPLSFATMLMVAGNSIETRILFNIGHEFGPLVLIMWTVVRWTIAWLTSIAVIALIYHNAVPRTQPWHSVLPGAVLATAMWYMTTALFGWYLRHYSNYNVIYGSLGFGVATLVWMYNVSLVVLVGAEFNAMLFPRTVTDRSNQ